MLLLLHVFLSLAVALDEELTEADLLQYGIPESQIIMNPQGNFEIDINRLQALLRTSDTFSMSA